MYRGTFAECSNNERYIESYMSDNQDVDSDDLLKCLCGEDSSQCENLEFDIETVKARQLLDREKTKMHKILSACEINAIPPQTKSTEGLNDRSRADTVSITSSASLSCSQSNLDGENDSSLNKSTCIDNDKNDKGHFKLMRENNKLLRTIVKQDERMIQLLSCLVEEQSSCIRPGEDNVYLDCNGQSFTAAELPRSTPNLFAIQFLKRILGADFKETIIEPKTPIQNSRVKILDEGRVQILKDALAANFKFFVFAKVRKSVNQAARDLRNPKSDRDSNVPAI